jgi:predicted MFS family arabinose efflux permease
LSFAALAALAILDRPGYLTVLAGIAAIVLWGASSTAVPPMLQSVAMRSAPNDPDGASGLYVAAFQVGIMAGSLSGGLLYERGGLSVMIAASAFLVAIALFGVVVSRGVFPAAAQPVRR